MYTSAKLGLTALMAAVLLSSAVDTASARNFSVSEQSFRIIWSSLPLTSGSTVRCRVTVEGSFHARTLAKVAGILIGAISRAIFAHPCTGGEAWADNGTETEPLGRAPPKLPWHYNYESFAGTLPNVQEVNPALSRISFVAQATVLGLTCRGRYGRTEDTILLHGAREARGGITSVTPDRSVNRASLVEQLGPNAVCSSTVALGGEGVQVDLATGADIFIVLI
jgi:hypothetical protein